MTPTLKAEKLSTPAEIPPWLPNAISVVRLALVPVWLVLAFEARHASLAGHPASRWGPIWVLLAIGISDLVDGALARRFGLTTSLGATLDAVADKLAQVSTVTFLALFGSTIFTPLPLWLLGVLVARDGVLGVGWWVVHRKRGTVNAEHRWHGKASSTLLFALIFAALAGVASRWVWLGSALVILLVIPSTVAYLREGWRQLQGQAPVGAPVSRTA